MEGSRKAALDSGCHQLANECINVYLKIIMSAAAAQHWGNTILHQGCQRVCSQHEWERSRTPVSYPHEEVTLELVRA